MARSMGYFNQTIDQIVPWMVLEDNLKSLMQNSDDYDEETRELLITMQTDVSVGTHAYFISAKKVHDWSSSAIPVLTTYIQFFDKSNTDISTAQKTLIQTVLGDGLNVMKYAQSKLSSYSAHFNQAVEKFPLLSFRLGIEFDSKSTYMQGRAEKFREFVYAKAKVPKKFISSVMMNMVIQKFLTNLVKDVESLKRSYEELRENLVKASTVIEDIKNKLKDEVEIIQNLNVQDTKVFANLDQNLKEPIVEAVQNLISNCNQFLQNYIQ